MLAWSDISGIMSHFLVLRSFFSSGLLTNLCIKARSEDIFRAAVKIVQENWTFGVFGFLSGCLSELFSSNLLPRVLFSLQVHFLPVSGPDAGEIQQRKSQV